MKLMSRLLLACPHWAAQEVHYINTVVTKQAIIGIQVDQTVCIKKVHIYPLGCTVVSLSSSPFEIVISVASKVPEKFGRSCSDAVAAGISVGVSSLGSAGGSLYQRLWRSK